MPCHGSGGDRGLPGRGRAGSRSCSARSYIDRCMPTPGLRPIPPDAHDRLASRAGWRVRAAGSLPQPRCRTSKFRASDRLSKGTDRHGGQRPRVTRPWLSHWTSKAASNWQREPHRTNRPILRQVSTCFSSILDDFHVLTGGADPHIIFNEPSRLQYLPRLPETWKPFSFGSRSGFEPPLSRQPRRF